MIISFNDLVNNYQYVGDIGTLLLCFVLLLCLKKSFLVINNITRIFISSIIFIILSSLCNLIFYFYIISDLYKVWVLTLMLTVSHILYSCIFHSYTLYILNLSSFDNYSRKKVLNFVIYVNIISIIICLLLRLYNISMLVDNTNILDIKIDFRPFAYSYILCIAVLAYVLFNSLDSIIKPLRDSLIISEIVCLVVLIVASLRGNISFINITFLAPIIVVMYTSHSSPYDIKSGALSGSVFQEYLEKISNDDIVYLCIKLYDFDKEDINDNVLGLLKSLYISYFEDSHLFNENYGVYTLAVNKYKNFCVDEKIKLACEILDKRLRLYELDYKIIVFNSSDINLVNVLDFDKFLKFMFNKFPINSVNICEKEIYNKIKRAEFIINSLYDIIKCGNLNDNRVLVYCQPIKDVSTGKYTTAEALMRLELDELGIISPNEFIPLMENLGVVHEFSMIMLNKICNYIKYNSEISRISLNFSIDELKNKKFLNDFTDVIKINDIPYEKIGVEFTESTNSVDFDFIRSTIKSLRELGCIVYLDDFGTGYSNFDRLLGLDMNIVKFDRSLLLLAETEEKTRYFINSFSSVFKKLGYKVLYEGIETDEQEELCINSSADYLQGYKYSKPIPLNSLSEFLKEG